jgi:hypothetical protein
MVLLVVLLLLTTDMGVMVVMVYNGHQVRVPITLAVVVEWLMVMHRAQ